MKTILVVILFIVSSTCFAQVQISSKHVKINAATQMSWSPGMIQQNSAPAGGKVFEVAIKIKKRGDYVFEKMIVDGQSLDIEMVKDGKRGIDGPYKKCSKWHIISRSDRGEVKDIIDPDIRSTINENQAVVGWIKYKFKGETLLAPVNQFESKSANSKIP